MGVVIELRSKMSSGHVPGSERSAAPTDDIDTARQALARRCWAWEASPLARRIELLDRVIADTAAVAPRWVARECERKRVAWGSPAAGEEWSNGPCSALRAARHLRAGLSKIEHDDRAAGPAWVATVLGSDSVSSIPFVQTIETLFCDGELVLLKLSPSAVELEPVLGAALHALIDEGYVRIVIGDPVSESRSVTPVIVVPGDWSARDFKRQARVIATMLTHGGSYERGAARLLITDRGWYGRHHLLVALRHVLHDVPNRFAFHPGAQGRFAQFLRAHPDMELIGAGQGGSLPWGLITNVDPDSHDLVFTTDPFAPILSETALRSSSSADFIDEAVTFCHERLSGTLVASVILDPACSRDPATAAALERGIARLRYRIVTINLPAFVEFGCVHDGRTGARHGKTVIRGEFRSVTTPPWLATHSHSHDFFRRLTRYEAAPTRAQLPALIWYSIKG